MSAALLAPWPADETQPVAESAIGLDTDDPCSALARGSTMTIATTPGRSPARTCAGRCSTSRSAGRARWHGGVVMSHGPLWEQMDAQPRISARLLTRAGVPTD